MSDCLILRKRPKNTNLAINDTHVAFSLKEKIEKFILLIVIICLIVRKTPENTYFDGNNKITVKLELKKIYT